MAAEINSRTHEQSFLSKDGKYISCDSFWCYNQYSAPPDMKIINFDFTNKKKLQLRFHNCFAALLWTNERTSLSIKESFFFLFSNGKLSFYCALSLKPRNKTNNYYLNRVCVCDVCAPILHKDTFIRRQHSIWYCMRLREKNRTCFLCSAFFLTSRKIILKRTQSFQVKKVPKMLLHSEIRR